MTDVSLSLTAAQVNALRKLDPVLTAKQVMQIHVDTWLAPIIAEMAQADRKALLSAYVAAAPAVQTQIKGLLGLG